MGFRIYIYIYIYTYYICLPYRKIYQSGVLMMSLCYKKPVVVSDLPSFKEVLKDKETAVFFSSENSGALSEAVNFLLNDEKRGLLLDIDKNH